MKTLHLPPAPLTRKERLRLIKWLEKDLNEPPPKKQFGYLRRKRYSPTPR